MADSKDPGDGEKVEEVGGVASAWDPADPEKLVGHKVSIQWSGGKMYLGEVSSYNKANKQHYIIYADGDKRWYRMTKKTFMVDGEEKLHVAEVEKYVAGNYK